jgi:hypothetical protein
MELTQEEYEKKLAYARKDMDCDSEHCSGCPYLIDGACELAESLI